MRVAPARAAASLGCGERPRYDHREAHHIEVSDETLAAMRRDPGEYASELRVAAAAKLYELGRVSQEVAAEIAGLNRAELLLALARFEVTPFQDTRESLEAELGRG